MTEDEIEIFYKNDNEGKYEKGLKEDSNVKYPEKISFSDGSEGKINVVRDNDKIKVYCSSDSDFSSKLMALNLDGAYSDEDEYYDGLVDKTVYKDEDNVYVVEYTDTKKDTSVQLCINYLIENIDKFVLGNEIKIK